MVWWRGNTQSFNSSQQLAFYEIFGIGMKLTDKTEVKVFAFRGIPFYLRRSSVDPIITLI